MSETAPAHILLVEDDETIALGIKSALEHAGYDVHHFDRGETALVHAETHRPDIALLDIMLPGIDGLEVLRGLKARYSDVPVILLTARGEEDDRVAGLESGADDYVPKPFSMRELIARVRARLRSADTTKRSPESVRVGEVELDLRRRILRRGSVEQRLTTHEAGVLAYLIEHQGRDVTREELLENVWGYSPHMQTRTVDNQILKLRKKVEKVPSDPRYILTVHGIGYRFEP